MNGVASFDITEKEKEGEVSGYTKPFGVNGCRVLSSKGNICVYRTIRGYDELK